MSEAPERIWAEPGLPGYLDEPNICYTVEYVRADRIEALEEENKRLREVLKEAGDVIESYHKSTGVDLGDASRMPFYADTMSKIDAALAQKGGE